MKRIFAISGIALCLIVLLIACGKAETGRNDEVVKKRKPQEDYAEMSQTGWTKAVPSEYTKASDQQGSVVRLDYKSAVIPCGAVRRGQGWLPKSVLMVRLLLAAAICRRRGALSCHGT